MAVRYVTSTSGQVIIVPQKSHETRSKQYSSLLVKGANGSQFLSQSQLNSASIQYAVDNHNKKVAALCKVFKLPSEREGEWSMRSIEKDLKEINKESISKIKDLLFKVDFQKRDLQVFPKEILELGETAALLPEVQRTLLNKIQVLVQVKGEYDRYSGVAYRVLDSMPVYERALWLYNNSKGSFDVDRLNFQRKIDIMEAVLENPEVQSNNKKKCNVLSWLSEMCFNKKLLGQAFKYINKIEEQGSTNRRKILISEFFLYLITSCKDDPSKIASTLKKFFNEGLKTSKEFHEELIDVCAEILRKEDKKIFGDSVKIVTQSFLKVASEYKAQGKEDKAVEVLGQFLNVFNQVEKILPNKIYQFSEISSLLKHRLLLLVLVIQKLESFKKVEGKVNIINDLRKAGEFLEETLQRCITKAYKLKDEGPLDLMFLALVSASFKPIPEQVSS